VKKIHTVAIGDSARERSVGHNLARAPHAGIFRGRRTTHDRAPRKPLLSNGRNTSWERHVLECVLLQPDLWPAIANLTPATFQRREDAEVFMAMHRLADVNKPIIVENVADLVDAEYFQAFILNAPVPESRPKNFSVYVENLRRESAIRYAGNEMDRMVTAIADGDGIDLEEIRKLAERMPAAGQNGNSTAVRLRSYADIAKEHLEAMWKGYLPLGKLVHLAGESGHGKSPLSVDLAARISSGTNWPDGQPNTLGPRSVILLASEDDQSDTVRPRLELAGGDVSKVFDVVSSVTKGMDKQEILLALDRDLEQLLAQARTVRDLAAMFIDPLSNYLGAVQMRLEEEVRGRLLMPLAAAAAELKIMAMTIGHFNRREKGTSPLHRIMGAAAFHGVARYIYLVGPDPDDDDKFAHVLVQARGGNAPALRYRTVAKPMTWDGKTSDVVQIEWRGTSEASSQDTVDPRQSSDKSAEEKAARQLADILKAGRVPCVEAKQLLKDNGCDVEKLNWNRVHHRAGVGSKRFDGERYYSWYLVTNQTP
jgi:hypothetical protein